MSHPWQFARGFCRVLNRSQKGRSSESRHGGQGWASRLRGWACEQALGSTLLAGHHWRVRATCGGPLWVPAPSQGPRMLAAPANSASRHSGWGSPRSPETPSCSASTGPDTDHAHPGLGRWLCGPSRAQDVRDQGPAQRANLPESCCSRHGSVHSSLGGGGSWEWECSPVRPLFGTERPQEGEMVQKSCLGRVRNRFSGTCLGLSVHIMGFPEESDGLQALEGVLPSPWPQHWLASVCDTGLYSALCFVSRLVHLGPLKPEDSGACRSSCQLPHITAQLLLPHPASAGQAAHCSCGW